MHAPFLPPGRSDHDEQEQIEVMRIRLWNARSATALLCEFHSADRVLERWALHPGAHPVGFEVTFVDGYVVSGSHEFFRKGKRRCLLGTHVRRMFERMTRLAEQGFPPPDRDLSRYLIPA